MRNKDSILLENAYKRAIKQKKKLIREMLGKSMSEELQDLVDGDQHLRQAWKIAVDAEGGFAALNADKRWDQTRQAFVEKHGTSLDDMFGDKSRHAQILSLPNRLDWAKMTENDWDNLAVLTQHMDNEPGFQEQMLEIFRQWRGEDSSEYRYLADRISCRENRTQRFGTQDAGTNYANCKWVRD